MEISQAAAAGHATILQLAPSPKPGLAPGAGLNGTGATLDGRPLRLHAGGGVPDLAQFARQGDPAAVELAPRSVTFVVHSHPFCEAVADASSLHVQSARSRFGAFRAYGVCSCVLFVLITKTSAAPYTLALSLSS